jgi:hypothetical protein
VIVGIRVFLCTIAFNEDITKNAVAMCRVPRKLEYKLQVVQVA